MHKRRETVKYRKWNTLRKTLNANKKLEKQAMYPKVKSRPAK